MTKPKLLLLLLSSISLIVILLITTDLTNAVASPSPLKKQSGYQPGIVLTFDDDYVDTWYNAEKELRPFNWKATFFICKYSAFTKDQKEKLHYLQNMGHDIAGHGYNHENAVKYAGQYGLDAYIKNEILPLKKIMHKDGFNIKSFAYPDGARDGELDKRLLKYFDFIRGTTYGELEPKSQYCYYENNRVIYGLGIDDDYEQFNLEYYKSLLLYAKEHNKIVIFYGHKTVDKANERLETPIGLLKQLCAFAVENNLKFYSVDDLKHLEK
ncbi:polysaccharide deacetylase family protein [Flavobacterium sp. MC2016-06]|jgi:peptidoglycan/xylan/chitin deacetylase (PgdA/CDA1 family)|uniref:polysaccharide deacetylase family protein n=1 Tax=Flavobacterium sp. MC2016-06 TaxID=2676308 RepID=UPI0012BB123D|nr:polysaccharide deacetylase family protein [Flavobacterium sp. MC2016-06]MBU3860469.1 polysaccharide deacetylase family protein [Flavobacterium sp. MC2016-06]